jgi:hypothetical protein
MRTLPALCVALLFGLSASLFGATVEDQTSGEAVTPLADASRIGIPEPEVFQSADPDEMADLLNQVQAAMELKFTPAQMEQIHAKVQTANMAEFLEYARGQEAFGGTNESDAASQVWSGGGWGLHASVRRNANFSPMRHFPSQQSLAIIEATGNQLSGYNEKLQKVSDRLERSKFACGNFDWVAQLGAKFNKEALEKYVDSLSESALAAAPMAFLANWSPTLYEIVKWLRAFAGADLNAEKVTCENMEQALTNVGQRMIRGPGFPKCIEANKHLSPHEAYRICGGGRAGIFDGVENSLGKIMSLQGGVEKINVTSVLGDMMRTPRDTTVDLSSETNAVAKAEDDLIEKQADLDAAPNPGPAPNVAEDSDVAKNYRLALMAHEEAKKALAKANDTLGEKRHDLNVASRTDVGFWNQLGNAVADNLPNIIGNIDISAKAGVHIGRQNILDMMLRYRRFGYAHAREFWAALVAHGGEITATNPDPTRISEGYTAIGGFCWETMQTPWNTAGARGGSRVWTPKATLDYSFSYETLDKMAFLAFAEENLGTDDAQRIQFYERYRVVELTNWIAQLEVFWFLVERTEEVKHEVLTAILNNGSLNQDGVNGVFYTTANNAFDDVIYACEIKREEAVIETAIRVAIVNKFVLTVMPPNQADQRPADTVMPAFSDFGR